MEATTLVHIIGGTLALITGFVALYTGKGGATHRRSGTVFVYSMLTLTLSALLIMALEGGPVINVIAAILTTYLVVTGLTTLEPPASGARGLLVAGLVVAVALGTFSTSLGVKAVASPSGRVDGLPAFPYFLFGFVGLLGSVLDIRMLRGGLHGPSRLTRHLWRMSFALLIAAMSFFFGQADQLPKVLRIPPLLGLPPLAVLVGMLYWLWRVRIRRSLRGLTMRSSAEPVLRPEQAASR
jgi:uncharacterized membrane protein